MSTTRWICSLSCLIVRALFTNQAAHPRTRQNVIVDVCCAIKGGSAGIKRPRNEGASGANVNLFGSKTLLYVLPFKLS